MFLRSPNTFFVGCLIRQMIALAIMALLPAFVGFNIFGRTPSSEIGPTEVSWSEVQAWSGPVLIVDARAGHTVSEARIPNALSLPESDWENRLPDFVERWTPSTKVLVYCDNSGCNASRSVAMRLMRELAITNVFVLEGGWSGWLARQSQQR